MCVFVSLQVRAVVIPPGDCLVFVTLFTVASRWDDLGEDKVRSARASANIPYTRCITQGERERHFIADYLLM